MYVQRCLLNIVCNGKNRNNQNTHVKHKGYSVAYLQNITNQSKKLTRHTGF